VPLFATERVSFERGARGITARICPRDPGVTKTVRARYTATVA